METPKEQKKKKTSTISQFTFGDHKKVDCIELLKDLNHIIKLTSRVTYGNNHDGMCLHRTKKYRPFAIQYANANVRHGK